MSDGRPRTSAFGSDTGQDLCGPFINSLPVDGASISVFNARGRQSSVCSSDPIAARIDEIQFELGEGPQWQAVRAGQQVIIPDVGADQHLQWPMFGEALQRLEVGAFFAIPLPMRALTVGAVCLYRLTPGTLADDELVLATEMARAVAEVAVNRAVRSARSETIVDSRSTPSMRREVHQATGMVLAQLETTAVIAYSRLQAYAFAHDTTIQDVARDVVTRQLNFRQLSE